MLNDESNQPSKFRTINLVEINDESREVYTSNDFRFKTTMLTSNLCDYADAYILVKGFVQYAKVKNQDLLKTKKQKGY